MENRQLSCCLLILSLAAAALLAGCQDNDVIVRQKVPMPDKPAVEEGPRDEKPKVRLLAAIVPHKGNAWFFKLLGPVEAVGDQKKTFEAFLATVRLNDDPKQPIVWQLPAGWKQEAGKGMRFATIRIGPEHAPLEMSVSSASGSVLANVNRWRDLDLGLKPILAAQLEQMGPEIQKVKVDGVEATLVDMSGPGTGKGMGGPLGPPR